MIRSGLLLAVFVAMTVVVATPSSSNADPTVLDVVVLMKGDPAPFSGILVPELRFKKYVRAELKVVDLEFRLQSQITFSTNMESMYLKRLEEATRPRPWYERPSFNRWLGWGLGVVTTGLIVWAGVEFVDKVAEAR